MKNAMDIETDKVLSWFKGKTQEKAQVALQLLLASIELGSWVKGAPRKVRAAFNKANKVRNISTHDLALLERLGLEATDPSYGDGPRYAASREGRILRHCMLFADFVRVQTVDFDLLRKTAAERSDVSRELLPIIEMARQYARDFAPVAKAIEMLDATRPRPTFTVLGVSPTLTATLKQLDARTVDVAPMKWVQVEEKLANGTTGYRWVVELVWPEGTRHGTSQYRGTSRNHQCESCGHAIKNAFNWLPLLVTANDGTLKSLWVGRDCAKKLFGIDMSGELEIQGE